MFGADKFENLFILIAFLFQVVLIIHFALRKWNFDLAMRFGPIVYALSIPAALASVLIFTAGKAWSFWLGGFIYLAWAIYGYTVEYVQHIEWRNSLRWQYLGPYVILYLATVMLYWWPLGLIYKPLWYGYAGLFIISTYLNVTSHQKRNLIPKES
jgi:hypothetical protein